jgi:hypothetical protein
MNRTTLLSNLAYADRHVRDSERHILQQREIVDKLERHGGGTRERRNWQETSWLHLKWHSQCISTIGRVSDKRCMR